MRYVDFLDVDVQNMPSLGQIDFDYDLARIASLKTQSGLPLVSHWLDPLAELAVPAAEGTTRELVRDAGSQEVYAQPTAAVGAARSTDLNGQPTLSIAQGALAGYFPFQNPTEVSAESWSALAVFNVPAGSTDTMAFISKGDDESVGAGKLWPSLRLFRNGSSDQIGVAEVGTNTLRVSSPLRSDLRGRTIVALGTFSVALGLRLYVNGVQVGSNASDVRPLNRTNVGFMANTPRNGLSLPAYGKFGWALVFRDDLSSSVNAGARAMLHEIVMRRYGITV